MATNRENGRTITPVRKLGNGDILRSYYSGERGQLLLNRHISRMDKTAKAEAEVPDGESLKEILVCVSRCFSKRHQT